MSAGFLSSRYVFTSRVANVTYHREQASHEVNIVALWNDGKFLSSLPEDLLMIANVVLCMLLFWFVAVVVITIRANIERQEHEATGTIPGSSRQNAKTMLENNITSAVTPIAPLLPAEVAAAQGEAPEVAVNSLSL